MYLRNPPMRGMNVLIVEESQAVAALLKDIFGTQGATVTVADAPFHAMALLRNGRYDLVTVEAGANFPAGMRVLEHIRHSKKDFAGKVVAITAYRYDRDLMSVLNAMRIPCVTKPFNVEELVSYCRQTADHDPTAAA